MTLVSIFWFKRRRLKNPITLCAISYFCPHVSNIWQARARSMLLTSLGERNFNDWKQLFYCMTKKITRTFLRNKSVFAFRSHFLLKLLQRARANIHCTSLSEARLQAVPPFWQSPLRELQKKMWKKIDDQTRVMVFAEKEVLLVMWRVAVT